MKLTPEKKVGAVVFAGIALLILFTVLLTDIHWFRRDYPVFVWFDNVAGLKRGDQVTLGGMIVGNVQEMELIEGRIRVRLAIMNDKQIPRAGVFRIVDVGLLGGKRVEVTWEEDSRGFLEPGEEVQGVSRPGLSEAISSLGDSGQKIEEILESVREVTSRIAEGEGTLGKLVTDDEVYRDAQKLFSDLRQALDDSLPGIRRVVDDLQASTPELEKSLSNLRAVSEQIASGEGTIGRLIYEEEVYQEAVEALDSLRTTSERVGDLAARAQRVAFYIGGDTTFNTRTERWQHRVYLQIEPASHKKYYIGVSILDRGETTEERDDDYEAEVDAQLGLRFFSDRLTVRGGLLEGRVGGGLDWRIRGRGLKATLEGRDVWDREKDEGIEPFLLRARVTGDLFWGFYAQAGVDNILDKPGFTIGAGLRIRDDDIGTLFGLVGLAQ